MPHKSWRHVPPQGQPQHQWAKAFWCLQSPHVESARSESVHVQSACRLAWRLQSVHLQFACPLAWCPQSVHVHLARSELARFESQHLQFTCPLAGCRQSAWCSSAQSSGRCPHAGCLQSSPLQSSGDGQRKASACVYPCGQTANGEGVNSGGGHGPPETELTTWGGPEMCAPLRSAHWATPQRSVYPPDSRRV